MFGLLKKKNKTDDNVQAKTDTMQKEVSMSAAKKESIKSVMEKTGWSREKTILQIEDAKRRIGITYSDYNKHDFYNIPVDQQANEYLLILHKKENRRLRKEENILGVMKKTGWNRKYAIEQMEEAKKRLGVTFGEYKEHEFYNIPVVDQEEKYNEINVKKIEKKKNKHDKELLKRDRYVSVVMKDSGWDKEYAETKMEEAKRNSGVSFEHYSVYGFWKLSDEVQKEFFSKRDADLLKEKYNKDSTVLQTVMNKDLFCKKFDAYLGRPWLSTKNMKFEDFKQKFENEAKIIYKPRSSSGGKGIRVFDLSEDNLNDVYNTISNLSEGLIEGFLVQHPNMNKLSVKSVNTIRVVTIHTSETISGVEKNKVNFVYAGLRMGYGDSYVDNLHSGGMIAAIDIDTGVVVTDGVNFANDVFEKHPDTNTVIKGFTIPYFNELKTMIENAGAGIDGYFGWDIAITVNGPVVVEINTHPGAECLQIPYVPQQKGMRYVVEKYFGNPKDDMKVIKEKKAQQEMISCDMTVNMEIVPEKPYGPKISGITKEGIEFYWKKPERANGYEVFRAYSEEGPYESIALIKKRSIGTHIDADFDYAKRKVYYTVRSFLCDDNGERIYSDTTKPVVAEYIEEFKLERDVTYLYSGTTRLIRGICGWGEPEDLEWFSDDESVATIDNHGVINAISSGTCMITAVSRSNEISASSQVVVDRKACEPLNEITSRYHFNPTTGFWENNNALKKNDAIIMMVGDMMCGKKQMNTQYSEEEGWNFNDSYEYTKEITASSDFAIGNLETLTAAGWPYMSEEAYICNKNNCNAPSRYLDAVRYAGFDAVSLSNNHNCDGGVKALLETIEQVNKYQLANTGAFSNAKEDRFFIADVNGIKVGFVAYMSAHTGFNGKDASWSKEEKDTLLNVFTPEKAKKDIDDCRAKGAEYVIAYMHWGIKNFRDITKEQNEEAVGIAEAGADYIVGANPHIVQVYDVIETKNGRKVPCAYSTGNYQSIMNQVTGNRDSVLLRIRLKKNWLGKVELVDNKYIPCYAYKNIDGHHWAPVALTEKMNSKVEKKNRKKIYNRIVKTMGDKIEVF